MIDKTKTSNLSMARDGAQIENRRPHQFYFPAGLPGYEWARNFELFSLGPSFGPYRGFRCLDRDRPVFVVVRPSAVAPHYEVELDETWIHKLELEDPNNEGLVLLIVTLQRPSLVPTANFVAPLVINTVAGIGYQVVQPKSLLGMKELLSVPFFNGAYLGS